MLFKDVSYKNDFNSLTSDKPGYERVCAPATTKRPEQQNNKKPAEYDSLFGMLCIQMFLGAPLTEMMDDALALDMPQPLQDTISKVDWGMAIEAYDEYRTDRLASRRPVGTNGRRADQGGLQSLQGGLASMFSASMSDTSLLAEDWAKGLRPANANVPGYHAGLEPWYRAAMAGPRI